MIPTSELGADAEVGATPVSIMVKLILKSLSEAKIL
jgi:hypothetical protein